jgi:hypothetical protein
MPFEDTISKSKRSLEHAMNDLHRFRESLASARVRDVGGQHPATTSIDANTIAILARRIGDSEQSGVSEARQQRNARATRPGEAELDAFVKDALNKIETIIHGAQAAALATAQDVKKAKGSPQSLTACDAAMTQERDQSKSAIGKVIDDAYEKGIALGTAHPELQDQILSKLDDLGTTIMKAIDALGAALLTIADMILKLIQAPDMAKSIGSLIGPALTIIEMIA